MDADTNKEIGKMEKKSKNIRIPQIETAQRIIALTNKT